MAFYSKEMEEIYKNHKAGHYKVYHIRYKGKTEGWSAKSLEFGYIGVASLTDEGLELRYAQEYQEYKDGLRPSRKLYEVFDKLGGMKKIEIMVVQNHLTKTEAYSTEEFLRPKRCDYSDSRIWNAKPGGKN